MKLHHSPTEPTRKKSTNIIYWINKLCLQIKGEDYRRSVREYLMELNREGLLIWESQIYITMYERKALVQLVMDRNREQYSDQDQLVIELARSLWKLDNKDEM